MSAIIKRKLKEMELLNETFEERIANLEKEIGKCSKPKAVVSKKEEKSDKK